MNFYLPSLWIATGACLLAGLHFLGVGRTRGRQPLYLAFGTLCLSVAAYLAASALMQTPGLNIPAGPLEQAHLAAACAVYPPAVWFFALYSRLERWRPWLAAAGLIFAGLFVANLLAPHGLLFADLHPQPTLILPWGEHLREFGGPGNPLALAYYASALAAFIWVAWRCAALWRSGDRRRALPLALYLALQAAAIIQAEVASRFNLRQPQWDALPFLVLVVLLSHALTVELRQYAADLARSNEALRDENSARQQAEAGLRHMAYHDALTDLPNRRALDSRLRALAAGPDGRRAALVILDPRRFKIINQTLGHRAGDQLMKDIAARLAEAGRGRVRFFVARLDGDEFALLLAGLPGGYWEAEEAVREALRQVDLEMARREPADGRGLRGEFRTGASIFEESGFNPERVLREAYMALHAAKSQDGNSPGIFSGPLRTAAERGLQLEQDLHSAIEQGLVRMEFQPQVNAAGTIIGAEGLLRWDHPELGPVPPEEFIPIAEKNGEIHRLGWHGLQIACSVLASLQLEGRRFRLAVNLSPWQLFLPDFIATVQRIVSETGADPARLTLEITESVFVPDLADASAKINALAELGVHFAIDDFGTGFASLALLKALPVHEVKIDQTFIHGMNTESPDQFLIAMVTLGKALELDVIAEGVETAAQRDTLTRLGCNAFQGYLFSRPTDTEGLRRLLG